MNNDSNNFIESTWLLIANEVLPKIKEEAINNEKFMKIINEFLSLPESVQKVIYIDYFQEFIKSKPISIDRFATIMKEKIEKCKENNIDLYKLKLEEENKKAQDAQIFEALKKIYQSKSGVENEDSSWFKEYVSKRRAQINNMTKEERAIHFYEEGFIPPKDDADLLLSIGRIDQQTYQRIIEYINNGSSRCRIPEIYDKNSAGMID